MVKRSPIECIARRSRRPCHDVVARQQARICAGRSPDKTLARDSRGGSQDGLLAPAMASALVFADDKARLLCRQRRHRAHREPDRQRAPRPRGGRGIEMAPALSARCRDRAHACDRTAAAWPSERSARRAGRGARAGAAINRGTVQSRQRAARGRRYRWRAHRARAGPHTRAGPPGRAQRPRQRATCDGRSRRRTRCVRTGNPCATGLHRCMVQSRCDPPRVRRRCASRARHPAGIGNCPATS